MVILVFIIRMKWKYVSSIRGRKPDLNPGLQGVSSQLSPLPTEICNLLFSEVIYDSTIDMIALRFKLKILCFSQKLSRGVQWVRQSALHCTTEAMTKHNNQSSIKRIYMTLKCMCVFLLFPLCFFSWRPIKNDSVTPYVFFMTTDKKQQCYPWCFFSWRPIKNNSVTPYVFFMTTNKKQQCYPLCFFSWRPIKNDSVTPYVFFHDDR